MYSLYWYNYEIIISSIKWLYRQTMLNMSIYDINKVLGDLVL